MLVTSECFHVTHSVFYIFRFELLRIIAFAASIKTSASVDSVCLMVGLMGRGEMFTSSFHS